MLPEDIKEAIARGPQRRFAPFFQGSETAQSFATRIAELVYQRGREDERKECRARARFANGLSYTDEAIEARGK